MDHARLLRFEPTVMLAFTSTLSPQVTAVRGSLISGAVALLSDLGHLDAVGSAMPSAHRSAMLEALASSWLPVDVLEAMMVACDALLSERDINQLGVALGTRITEVLFATIIRPFRGAGTEALMRLCISHGNRMWERIYQGGGMTIWQTGPKDLRVECQGLPFARSRSFQAAHVGFLTGLARTAVKSAAVKLTRCSTPDSGSIAVAISWV